MAYTSDEQLQVEEIKSLWKEYGKTVIVSVILAIVGVFGWQYWQDYTKNKIEQSSTAFDQTILQVEQNPNASDEVINNFVKQYGETNYAVFALFDKAKREVEAGQFANAENTLKQTLSLAKESTLSNIARLRLATVQLQQKEYEMALEGLTQITDAAWLGKKAILLGDIYLAQGNKEQAKKSYEEALKTATSLEAQ